MEFRATVVASRANIRSAPSTSAPIVRTARRGQTLLVAEIQGSWVRLTSYRNRGPRWIQRDLVQLTRIQDEPPDH